MNEFIRNCLQTLEIFVENISEQIFRINFNTVPSIVNLSASFTGLLLHVHTILALNETRILLQTPLRFNVQHIQDLNNFLDNYFVSCTQQIDGSETTPRFQVQQDTSVVQRFIEFYTEILDESKIHEMKD